MDGDVPLWSPALASGGTATQKLKDLQQSQGVLLIRNKAKKHVKYFGPDAKYDGLQKALLEMIASDDLTNSYHRT